jgi:hypothetical protein
MYTSQYNKALKFGDSVQQQGKNQFTQAAQNLDMQNSSSKQHGTSLAQTLKVRWKARQEIKKKTFRQLIGTFEEEISST